jgi:predicted dehydrogenase
VKIVDSPEAVAEQADLVLIESVDGRVHRKQFEQIARFKKPTFIDKPMTTSLADAQAIFRLADENSIPVMSCSSLRYAQNLLDAMPNGRGDIAGVDAFGPVAEEAALPGLYWYGIHTVEMIVAVMGTGCAEVQAFRNANDDIIRMGWSDGRQAMMRGTRNGHHKFGLTLHRKDGAQYVDASGNKKPYYAGLLEAIFRSLPHGKSDIPTEETLEVIRIIDAANQSRQTGAIVKLGN